MAGPTKRKNKAEQMNDPSFIEMIDRLFGGAVATLIGAFTGRLMYHSGEVKLGKRRFFGKELFWEIPVAVGMALIGEAAASYIGLGQPVSTGFVATLAYLGPRGAESVFAMWLGRKK